MLSLVRRLWQEEDGQAMTEYGLILGIIAVAVIAALVLMRDELNTIFSDITSGLQNTESGS
ncbi:MAG: Flp family type IVb pilin [Zhaonellaceae bacterium]|jgi:pilus assembly protein Flp/PilA|nr:Flp family type IVb pilin [Clostridia bacterium]